MHRLALLALCLLTACGTPQQQCIGTVTRDLRILDRLIKETADNLDRGFGYRTVTVYETEWVDCSFYGGGTNPRTIHRRCFERFPITSREPVAIDLAAEEVKLAGLRKKRAQLERSAQPGIAACRAEYPE